MNNNRTSLRRILLGATALALTCLPSASVAQQTVVVAPAPNTEPDTNPGLNASGFVFSIDGVPVNADPRVEDQIRRTDIALANADVQVQYNGLNPTPRLNLELGVGPRFGPGAAVEVRSEANYPAFIARGEVRIYDQGAIGGARLLATVPLAPNGTAQFTVPDGKSVVAVYRVYDSAGRYDETVPLPLDQADSRNLTANEDGLDATALRNIRVSGGAVTVSARGMGPGATLNTLGESVRADGQGRLVIERILPPGDYAVDVAVRGPGQSTDLSRQLSVPASEWQYVGSGELTYSGIGSSAGPQTTGRLSFYIDGKRADGTEVTASLDTAEGDLGAIFQRLDRRDPQNLAERLAYKDNYPTFGDDSQLVDNTPTSGRIYLRVQRDGNFVTWGDYQARLKGSEFLRNERTLYGAQAHLETGAVTTDGDARAALDVYASQPDQLVQRDVFRGTGGSVYFLSDRDVTAGTATVSVELRDASTGRVIDRVALVEGRDYEVDYIQGLIILTRPLDGSASNGLIQSNPGGDVDVNLIAQYEYTPSSVAAGALSYGARVEAWVTDDLRVGITGMHDDTGASAQTAGAVDLHYNLGANSFVQLDYARTDGSGFGTTTSLDGGLGLETDAVAIGKGEARRVVAQLDFGDLGLTGQGTVGGYYEHRTEGFSTLDYQVTSTTGDETLYGLSLTTKPREGLSFTATADRYENGRGDDRTEVGAQVNMALTDRLSAAIGLKYLDETTATTNGTRTDLGGRLTYALRETTDLYVFGQQAVKTDGLAEYNRVGLGVQHRLANGWSFGAEISDGTGGLGGEARVEQQGANGQSTYFGYELDPGRALDAGISQSDNGGKFVAGGRRSLSDTFAVFGENIYDVFGSERSLSSAYGVEYQASDYLSYSAAVNYGQVRDAANGDFDRRGLSLGLRYADDATTVRLLGEVRIDDAGPGSTRSDAQTYIATADVGHKFNESSRLLFALRAAQTDSTPLALTDGRFVDVSLGYALRPVADERFNMLAMVRHLYDGIGQTVDGVAGVGDVQISTVLSIDANYDLSKRWTVGGKLGYRLTKSGTDLNNLTQNDALLAIANARYHFVHKWDGLLEVRHFKAMNAGTDETGALAALYRHVGRGTQIGVGYNFGSISDDLTDLTTNDGGLFLNIVTSF